MATKKPQPRRKPVFTKDEMSTGRASKLRRRAEAALAPATTGSFSPLTVDPPRPSVSNDPVRDEIRYRERQATVATASVRSVKPAPPVADLHAQQLKKQAEENLTDELGDDGFDEFDEEEDTVPGLD